MADDQSDDPMASGTTPTYRRGRNPLRIRSAREIDPFDTNEQIDSQLERLRKIGDADRSERWANVRQALTIATFVIGLFVISAALCFSIYILLTRGPEPVELAKWILETLLGALVAGLIGFWAVKSFEK